MNCELFQTEMHTWRNQSDSSGFEALFKHLTTCPQCTDSFRLLTQKDEEIRRMLQGFPEPRFLDRRILAGLKHERAQANGKPRTWMFWTLAPILASLIAVVFLGWVPALNQKHLECELAVLLNQPPASQVVSTDRQQLLDWSAEVLHGSALLPPELSRVQFKGGTALEIAHHKAVLLKMRNEQRASLLVVDGALTKQTGFTVIAENSGNASLWTDGNRTYVLLFNGSRTEMQGYMEKMGITT